MKLSRNGIKFIIDFEGKHKKLPDGRYQAYQCVVGHDPNGHPIYDGKWTIYTGLTEGIHEGMIVTEAEGMEMFRRELAKFEDALNRLVVAGVNQNQFDALVSFSYNVGSGALAGSTLLKKLNRGDFAGASREFGKWTNSNGVKNVPGLVSRRAKEAALFMAPAGPPEPAMPQVVDTPTTVASNLGESRSIWAGVMGLVSIVGGIVTNGAKSAWDGLVWLLGIAPTIATDVRTTLTPVQEMAGWFGSNIQKVTVVVAVVCIVTFLVRHAMLRIEAKS